MWRSNDYAEDLMDVDPSEPATAAIFRGAAFMPQQVSGPTYDDPLDDRVTFIGDAEDPTVQLHRSMRLEADLFSTGDSVDGGVIFGAVQHNPNPNGNDGTFNTDPRQLGAADQSTNHGQWYDTLRPNAGFPLPVVDDQTYAAATGDMVRADPHFGVTDPLLVTPGERYLPEKPLDMPSRLSMQPSSEQAVYPGFDSIMGADWWSGAKRAMERPVADPGPYFRDPIGNSLPSPTGAGGAMTNPDAYNLYPQPLTFRAPPVEWDTGYNSENGYYVESGN